MTEQERDPHHPLNEPATEPDPTEWPDPYDRRPDPLGPDSPESVTAGATSTSEPHPSEDPEAVPEEKLERERLED
jgi:hypothetical protein